MLLSLVSLVVFVTLTSGVMDARNMLNRGVKMALGTDVAGGYSPSMLDAIRQVRFLFRLKKMKDAIRQVRG